MNSTLLGNLSTRCWSVAIRMCVYSATRALKRYGLIVGEEASVSVLPSEVETKRLCGTLDFFYSDINTLCFHGSLFFKQGHFHARTDLVNFNLKNLIFFSSHKGGMSRCSQTFGHIVNL